MTRKTPTKPPQTGAAMAPPEVTRLFCTDCGTRNSADSKYCKECGAKINDGYRTMMLSIEDIQGLEDEQSQNRLTRLLDMAFWHNEAGHTDSAIRAAEAALVIQSQSTTAHSLLGSLYEKKGDDAKAVEHFQAVVDLNPESIADAAKLDQVRRGVHVRAVTQPPSYMWVPPALAGLKWVPVRDKFTQTTWPAWKGQLRKRPAAVAAAAVVIVGMAGWLLVRPSSTPAKPNVRVAMMTPAPLTGNAANSAFGGAYAPPTRGSALPGSALSPRVQGTPAGPKKAVKEPDPFAETLAPGTPVSPVIPTARRPRRTSVVDAESIPIPTGPIGEATSQLPPLHVVPMSSPSGGGLAPAPVSLSGVTPAATPPLPVAAVAAVPQHTVVVPHLSAQTAAYTGPAGGVPTGDGGAAAGSAPPAGSNLSSHIHISINSSPTAQSISISDGSSPSAHPAEAGDDGDSFQQTAMQYQQQGEFAKARAAYQKAIRAYNAQIAAGRDTEAARRGLQACRTGLQICEQSQ